MTLIGCNPRIPLALLLTMTAPQAFGALPPQHQRAAELSAAITAAADLLLPDRIDRVEYTATDQITVRAGKCFVVVTLVDVIRAPRALVGPRAFEARPGPRICD